MRHGADYAIGRLNAVPVHTGLKHKISKPGPTPEEDNL